MRGCYFYGGKAEKHKKSGGKPENGEKFCLLETPSRWHVTIKYGVLSSLINMSTLIGWFCLEGGVIFMVERREKHKKVAENRKRFIGL